jgi:hypothetical protein
MREELAKLKNQLAQTTTEHTARNIANDACSKQLGFLRKETIRPLKTSITFLRQCIGTIMPETLEGRLKPRDPEELKAIEGKIKRIPNSQRARGALLSEQELEDIENLSKANKNKGPNQNQGQTNNRDKPKENAPLNEESALKRLGNELETEFTWGLDGK